MYWSGNDHGLSPGSSLWRYQVDGVTCAVMADAQTEARARVSRDQPVRLAIRAYVYNSGGRSSGFLNLFMNFSSSCFCFFMLCFRRRAAATAFLFPRFALFMASNVASLSRSGANEEKETGCENETGTPTKTGRPRRRHQELI